MRKVMVATVILALALTGGAYASGKLTGKDIKDGSLTGRDVKDHSLTPRDFKGSVRGPAGPRGAQGPQGPQGLQGPAGTSGVSRITGYVGQMTVDANAVDGGTLSCPAGQRMVSGGFFTDSPGGQVFLSEPSDDQTGWSVGLDNSVSSVPAALEAEVNCAGAGAPAAARGSALHMSALSGRAARAMAARRSAR